MKQTPKVPEIKFILVKDEVQRESGSAGRTFSLQRRSDTLEGRNERGGRARKVLGLQYSSEQRLARDQSKDCL